MYTYLKNILFKLDPEHAHTFAEVFLRILSNPAGQKIIKKFFAFKDERLSQELLNTSFVNPIGLAAGFDKNATMLPALSALGFSHIEYGTITPKAQKGNNKPRLFRHVKENSLQNAMGFNNKGVREALLNVKKFYSRSAILGASIGKNKITPNKNALYDYGEMFERLNDYCEYFAINISSPNTKGLRELQNIQFIEDILSLGIQKTKKPILLKFSPDMDIDKALLLSESAINNGASGIIATNTTTQYSLLKNAKNFGGISGEVLREKSYNFFKPIGEEFHKKTTLISVGGISSGKEAYKRIRAGAHLVQIYTSFIFQGPNLIKKMNQELLTCLQQDGYTSIQEAVGADYK